MRTLKSVSLDLPARLRPPTNEDEYTPKKVKKWVENLPRGHRGETTKQLFRQLRQFNSVDIPVRERFEIMQILVEPLDHTVQVLQHHLLNQPIPLTERSILTAEVVNELLANMVIGFRLVLAAGQSKNWLYQRAQQRMWIESLYHILRYFERILTVHRMLHFARPKGLWKGVHNLYQETRNAEWHRTPIELYEGAATATTIELEYKKTLLVALLSHHQVRSDQYDDEIVPLLDHWASLTELRAAGCGPEQTLAYCILPDTDTPPMAMDTLDKRECGGTAQSVVLDTSHLRLFMLEHLRSTGDTVTIHNHAINKDTLELLFDSWCTPHVRREPRRPGKGVVAITLGVTHTNRVICSRYQEAQLPAEDLETISLESLRSVLAPLFEETDAAPEDFQQDIPVTNIVYAKGDVHRSAWVEFSRRNGYAPLKAEVVNLSDHGYCLSVIPPESEHVRNGDIVGVYNAERRSWDLGRLAWLKGEPDHNVLMGLQLIATAVLPVKLRIVLEDEQHSEAMPALIGHGSDNELIILLSYLPAVRQKRFVVEYFGHFAPIELIYRVAATPSFIAYSLGTGDEEETTRPAGTETTIATQQVAEKPPARTPRVGNDEQDEYAQLWDRL